MPRPIVAPLLGLILLLLAASGCAERALPPPPPERPYWRVEPNQLENLPRLPSPVDTFRA